MSRKKKCPHCRKVFGYRARDGKYRVKLNKSLFVEDDGVVKGLCTFCKGEIELDFLTVDMNSLKKKEPILVLKKA